MARNGSGTYNLPTGNPVVTGTAISSSTHNTTMTDIATALSASIVEDGQNPFTANQPMGGFKLTGLGAATARTDAMSLANAQDGTGVYAGTVGGTADVITLTLSPVITAYAAGQRFSFIASGANTTNVTVNVNSVGAKAVTKNGTTALVANDILSGMIVVIEYDGTQFQLITQANLVDKSSTQTVAGVKTFSGANVHSGNNTFSGDNTHSGISTFSGTIAGGTPFVFEGATADAFETSLVITDPTADRTLTMPDADVNLTNVTQASATQTGFVELATEAEVETGTDTARVPSVATLRTGLTVHGAVWTSTSGTGNTWGSLPSWITEIKVMFNAVSLSGTDVIQVQIGDSGGLHTTGYTQGASRQSGGGNAMSVATTGFIILNPTAANTSSGTLVISLLDPSNFVYTANGSFAFPSTTETGYTGGVVTLDTVMTQIRVLATGSDTFDAGSVNIYYR